MAGIESSSGPQKQNMGDLARRMDEILTVAHASDATKVIRLAKSLRNSRNDDVKNNVYINPNLTHEQRTIQYNLYVLN